MKIETLIKDRQESNFATYLQPYANKQVLGSIIQKQSSEVFHKKRYSQKFHKIHRKTPVPGLKACNCIKKETLAQVFSCEFCEISKNTFFTEHLRTTASYNYLNGLIINVNFVDRYSIQFYSVFIKTKLRYVFQREKVL